MSDQLRDVMTEIAERAHPCPRTRRCGRAPAAPDAAAIS